MVFVGLTSNPVRSRVDHGNPSDWEQRTFETEAKARTWLAAMSERIGHMASEAAAENDWQFGYSYTVTMATKEF